MLDRETSESERGHTRRQLLARGGQGVAGVAALGSLSAFLEACGGGGGGGTAAASANLPASITAGDVAALAAAAKKEGHLNVLGVAPDWANYGVQIRTFQTRYGIAVTSQGADDSSAEEIQAMKSLKGQKRAPDTFDISPTFALSGTAARLFTPFRPSTWDTIPDDMKDADGNWIGPYWGAISFGANTNVVKQPPTTWEDLKSSRFKGMVALDGDPRTAGDAFGAVMAASIANGGSLDDIEPGINYFADLKKSGNYIPATITPATIANGSTPVAVQWDYINSAFRQEFRGNPTFEVTIPEEGVLGNYYCDGISVSAPNPNAVRLWLEFLLSDEGQKIYIGGFAHPARYDDLVRRNQIPQALADTLPPPDAYKDVRFPSVDQTNTATRVLMEQWGPKVAGH